MRNSSRLRNDCKLLSGLDVREVSTFALLILKKYTEMEEKDRFLE